MKKFASLVLTAVLLAAMLSVFALPAFAAEAPTEYVPEGKNINLSTGGNFIISRDCEVTNCSIGQNVTLTIAKGVTVTVKTNFTNFGTIYVGGTLNLSDTLNHVNAGTINVCTCGGGKLEGNVSGPGTVSKDKHHFVNGFCLFCGKACDNPFHNNDKCPDCGMSINGVVATGSTLSEGSITIICTVAAAVVFGLGGFILGTKKKKKPALASGENTDKE